MFEEMIKKNTDSDAQLASHNTSIHNLEVQFGQISQALNTRPKGALPSDMVVNPKGGNNTGHAMAVTTRSGRGGVVSTSNPRKVVSDDVLVQDDDEPSNHLQVNIENMNDEVRVDIDDNVDETQNDVNPSREHVIDIPEMVVLKAKDPLPRPPPPYPQSLAKQNNENQLKKFIDMMKSLSINVPLVEALEQMPGYAKFMKDLVTKKRSMHCETIKMPHQVSAIVHFMALKLEDPGAFTIPCTIGSVDFAKALCDLGASINLMPYSVFKKLGNGKPRTTSMRHKCCDKCGSPLEAVLLNRDVDEKEGLVKYVNALQGMGSYTYQPRKLSLDLENRKTPPTKPSIEEPPTLELKPLPSHLR
ncbi:uncharacterized protein [Nicotiana sylvestris]|uniref:uncharacterized protein n=1 Tax=Nicotiana sylvestris TaxID=4096 RepID=UPI00388CE0D3